MTISRHLNTTNERKKKRKEGNRTRARKNRERERERGAVVVTETRGRIGTRRNANLERLKAKRQSKYKKVTKSSGALRSISRL